MHKPIELLLMLTVDKEINDGRESCRKVEQPIAGDGRAREAHETKRGSIVKLVG
jgi:hypothetical protein